MNGVYQALRLATPVCPRAPLRPGRPRPAALSVARGNGKTVLVAGDGSVRRAGRAAGMVPRGETIIVAVDPSRKRCIAFDHVAREFMGPTSSRERKAAIEFWQTGAACGKIEDRETGARTCGRSGAIRNAPMVSRRSLILADEPAQWPGHDWRADDCGSPHVSWGSKRALRLRSRSAPARQIGEHWFAKMLAGIADYAQTPRRGLPDDPPFQRRTWKRRQIRVSTHLPDLEADNPPRRPVTPRRDPSVLHRVSGAPLERRQCPK